MSVEKKGLHWCPALGTHPLKWVCLLLSYSPPEKLEPNFGDGFAHEMGVQVCERVAVGFLLM